MIDLQQYSFIIQATIAGILASIACGFGALPLMMRSFDVKKHIGLSYGFAGGLMFSASVYNLLLPALNSDHSGVSLPTVCLTLVGVFSGALLIYGLEKYLSTGRMDSFSIAGLRGKKEILIFIAMACHSIPEGIAVGVGYGSAEQLADAGELGKTIALAIAIHNIPEGLAVSIPIRAKGASISRCFFLAFLTSLPQPLAAIPASALVWIFHPLLVPSLGFAAGAMMYLVLVELLPDALNDRSPNEIAWAFMFGFGALMLIQVLL